jgi:hypothetical protein
MNSLLRAGLLAVLVIAGVSFNASAAAPTANDQLNVNVSVSVPRVMRIQWGADSTAVTGGPTPTSVANTTNAVAWNIGAQDFDATVVLNVGQLPTLPAYVLSIKNAGTTKVDVQARVEGADTGSATQKWTVGAAPAVDVCAIAVNALQLTGTDQELAAELKRADAPVPVNITFRTPTDSNFGATDTGVHAFQVRFTATAP